MNSSPFYKPQGDEIALFNAAYKHKIPVLLKGPTGCGKSRFLEYISHSLKLPMITVSCNEDSSGADLLGRFLLQGNETVWIDGPVTSAVRKGALLYLDEIVEAREDVIVVLHSLADHRRELYLDRTRETLKAHPNFQLVVSFNPGYQTALKEMKPSTRQRFVAIPFEYPDEELELQIIEGESSCSPVIAKQLASLAKKIRSRQDLNLRETVSTRLLVHTAKLAQSGLSLRQAALHGIVEVLTDDLEIKHALSDFVTLRL